MELRTVDPRSLRANPVNPRKTAASPDADAQLVASIRAIGIVQPPLVQADGDASAPLTIVHGHRRVRAAIAAEKEQIIVLVQDDVDAADPMKAVAENLVRAEMGPVDRWRAMESLAGAGWTDDAIASALNLTVRNIAQLRLLAHICPPMLDRMAQGDMPNERQLRTIAAASTEEQGAAWKKHKPKRTEGAQWRDIADVLTKRRMSAQQAKFGPDEEAAFGLVWEEDLFAPAGEDSRTTTQVDAFLAAQQAWLEAHLPKNGTLVTVDEYGRPDLPKGAQQHWGKPGKGDTVGHHVDPRTGEIQTVVFTPPAKARKTAGDSIEETQPERKPRPDLTQKGQAQIGDLRTDALHQALRTHAIDDDTLIGLLVLAIGANNVDIKTGVRDHYGSAGARTIAAGLTEGNVLTRDSTTLRTAAREILVEVLSCRDNQSASGVNARFAGMAIDADALLPNMATEDFLSCLSKTALERAAGEVSVRVQPRGKDTRAGMISRFKDATWVYPNARFAPTEAELEAHRRAPLRQSWTTTEDDEDPVDDSGVEPDPDQFDGDDELAAA